MKGVDVLRAVTEKAAEVWRDIPSHMLHVQDEEGDRIVTDSKILEGSNILVSVFRLMVVVPQVEDPANPEGMLKVEVKFKATSNVKAIQGAVFAKLPGAVKKKVKCKDLVVKYKDEKLDSKTNLSSLDWKEGESIVVAYD